jgi:thiamine biosynthesis lipoprotein
MLNRRRFLTISAAAVALPRRTMASPHVWSGAALGARATIRITHPDAPAITARAAAEIDRLEGVFSLYRPDSALARLNATGRLDAPPFELLECLTLAGSVHLASGGLFDPTVQRLWEAHAEAAIAGRRIAGDELAEALALTGWGRVRVEADAVSVERGMALTLNGIAQGFVADRVAALLEAEGLTDILIDTGEFRALGGQPDGGVWPVKLAQGGEVGLRGRALATSAPLGTTFDPEGRLGHILDPRTGQPERAAWRAVSVTAPQAALADALSTALCLTKVKAEADAVCDHFADVKIESLLPA